MKLALVKQVQPLQCITHARAHTHTHTRARLEHCNTVTFETL